MKPIDPSTHWERARIVRCEEELMRAVYFQSGGVVTRYPIGLGGMWRYGAWANRRFRSKPNDMEIERMLRLRKHAMTNKAIKVYQRVEELLIESGIKIIDTDSGTIWERTDEENE